jgi:hypothetical protein
MSSVAYHVSDHGPLAGGNDGSDHVAPYPNADKTFLTGICTGLISAAAVSHATSISELATIGVQAVAVAFRLGACAWDVGSRIAEPQDGSGRYQRWTAALLGLPASQVQYALTKFIQERVRPHLYCLALDWVADLHTVPTTKCSPLAQCSDRAGSRQHLRASRRLG